MDIDEERDVFDVAVVGFGPSGAVAAGLLAKEGLRVFVCDRLTGVYDKPRAIAIDHEVMRAMQQLGVAEDIARHVEPFTPSAYLGADGRLIKRLTMVAPPHPLGYTPSNVFTQPPVEELLRAHVQAAPGTRVVFGAELRSLEQDPAGVTLRIATAEGADKAEGDGTQAVRARYVIGCDGASSTVRGLAGLALHDLDFDEPWLVVDVRVNERGLAKLPETSVQYCEPDRPCTLVIGPGNHRRWEISLKPGEDPREVVRPEVTWKLLERWLSPDDGELWRQAAYRFHALVAERWRDGRVFIAGDAAHQQPPFLGQGMCQGVRDVVNLAWKLVAVLRGDIEGDAAERLLDSYGEERGRHVRTLTGRIKAIGAVIGERDADRARARDARLLAECGGVVRDTPRQDVIPGLETGWLASGAHPGVGTIFPQPWLDLDGVTTRLDALAGDGWWLALDDARIDAAAIAAALPALPALKVLRFGAGSLRETEGVVADWFERHGCRAAIVRPDRYVWGVAGDVDALRDLVDRLGRDWR
jgi:3-(3-hydroxy-phenyl)propionate hydroxylase